MENNIIREPEKFSQELLKLLKKKISKKEKLKIDFRRVVRCNDQVCHGITIMKDNEHVARNFYVEQLFASHQEGKSLEELADEVLEMAEDDSKQISISGNSVIEKMTDYEFMRNGHLMVRLFSRERNHEFLSGKLYVPYLDLALAVYAIVDKDQEDGLASACISMDIFEQWGVDKEEVISDILMQMGNLFPVECMTMENMFEELMGKDEFSKMMNPPEENEMIANLQLYIMTNKDRVNGSATIVYPGALETFAKQHGVNEVDILPSSQHEVILIPNNEDSPARSELAKMIREVNRTAVMDGEVLSDNLYIYNADTDQVHIWNGLE